jgi:hypothetical protein
MHGLNAAHTCTVVTRFPKEELLRLRRPTKILESMRNMSDVISVRPLDPVCLEVFEPEEVCLCCCEEFLLEIIHQYQQRTAAPLTSRILIVHALI